MSTRSKALWRLIALSLPAALGISSGAAAQADQIMTPSGGLGGGQFFARCAQGELLNGFELRTGNDVDGIRPICRAAYSATDVGPRNLFPTNFGGPGAGVTQLVCPDETPIVTAMWTAAEGDHTMVVNDIWLWCGLAAADPRPPERRDDFPTVKFSGPNIPYVSGPHQLHYNAEEYICPAGLVAVGINGRSGVWLDAVGLTCGRLKFLPSPYVKSVGRVHTGSSSPPDTRSICDKARDARARNSLAAANLEAQCEQSKKPPPRPPVIVTEVTTTLDPSPVQAAEAAAPATGAGTSTTLKPRSASARVSQP